MCKLVKSIEKKISQTAVSPFVFLIILPIEEEQLHTKTSKCKKSKGISNFSLFRDRQCGNRKLSCLSRCTIYRSLKSAGAHIEVNQISFITF